MSLLEIRDLVSGYEGVPVLHGISLTVDEGELVTVIGANGAGKSTLLRTISGVTRASSGTVRFGGRDVVGMAPARVAGVGIAHVPENRRVFAEYAVEDNLRIGAFVRRADRRGIAADMQAIYEQFPILQQRRRQPAGALSGGEQQMLALGMALMARPKLLLLDEPSLGLAPLVLQRVFEEIQRMHEVGTTILLVEQIARLALRVADRGLVMQLGRVTASGSAAELRNDPTVQSAYLGA